MARHEQRNFASCTFLSIFIAGFGHIGKPLIHLAEEKRNCEFSVETEKDSQSPKVTVHGSRSCIRELVNSSSRKIGEMQLLEVCSSKYRVAGKKWWPFFQKDAIHD